MKDNVVYPARLENLVLLDGKDLDVSEIAEKIRKDCRRLLFGYIFCVVFCIGFLTCMIIFRDIYQGATDILKAVLVGIILIAMAAYSVLSIVGLWKVKYKAAFKGIRATCDNVIRSSSKGGIYHAYHCTTELGDHGITFVNGYRRRADIGDDIMYIRILNHDFIYKDLEYIDGEGNGTPLQYSRLENPMDGGPW